MNIKINKLFLQNFKGIKNLVIDAEEKNLTIYGDNATGKTTVFDAFTWLLFGKDSLGRADFGIKTQDENGNVIHNLEHSVECELAIDNSLLTLKKVFSEKWTKKRGSSEAEFSGHETKYFVNEVPTSKKDYEFKIASIIDETLFKIITNPLYFNEHLKWQDRRAILLNLCNNLSDEEILIKNERFSVLNSALKGRTIEEYKSVVKSQQNAINNELKAIPQRISEAYLAIPENVSNVDENERTIIETEIANLNDKITALKSGAGLNEISVEINALKQLKADAENRVCNINDLEQKKLEIRAKIAGAELEISGCKQKIESAEFTISEHEKKADSLRKQWQEVNNKQYDGQNTCPTCGQILPYEQIEKAKTKFNTQRAEQLESITELGKKAKAICESNLAEKQKYTEKLSALQSLVNSELKPQLDLVETTIAKTKADFEEKRKADILDIEQRIAESENKVQNSGENIETAIYTINTQIAEKRAKLSEIDKAIAERTLAERQKARISELEADEKRLATEYAELEAKAFLLEEFTKFKVELLNEEINSHFKYAKFKLFEQQINGGIAECCEVTYKGVPYSDLNNASRINIGLDIINTLCELNDKYAPVIVDNSESVTNILPTVSQMICLVVSAEDKKLRIEKNI